MENDSVKKNYKTLYVRKRYAEILELRSGQRVGHLTTFDGSLIISIRLDG